MADSILPVSRYCDYGHIVAALLSIQQTVLVDIQTHAEIIERMTGLEAAGVPNYSPYWLNGYLYLSHPKSAARDRHRSFVGRKPERVQAALEAIARRDRYRRLRKEKEALERRVDRVVRSLIKIVTFTKEQI